MSDIKSKAVTLVLACVTQLAVASDSYCQQTEPLVAQHQKCVLRAFARDAGKASAYDPTLLDKAVGECEKILSPLKKSILARTHDPAFADNILDKIRRASKRGVAVVLVGLLQGKVVTPSSGQTSPPTPAGGGGMLDSIDPNGMQTLRGTH
jgi:hypothetical protein